ncbi:MAG: hypothetical protein J6N18_13555, partial [Kiritimatiellae bacterium]|nr:hypothetical protein [Kiritimatiellia bacterium]
MGKAPCRALCPAKSEALKANFRKPSSHASHLGICKSRSSAKWGCALRAVELSRVRTHTCA